MIQRPHHRVLRSLITLAITALVVALPFGERLHAQDDEWKPSIAAASGEGAAAIKSFQVPAGFKVSLFAAEPDVANPVAFAIDPKGRIYVCETYRQGDGGGVTDNRNHMYWLDDDLAAKEVRDRRAMILKYRSDKLKLWSTAEDRIRVLADNDGDGKADASTVFARGFNDLIDGTGAGVLVWDSSVYYTCIPNLWQLKDNDNDGFAETKLPVHRGFGVKVSFRGHDLHGLVMGPDGKLYFSVGDRGYNVVTTEGKHLVDPDSGAVFRCNLDGSDLEVVYTGLRNPQELAFDAYGNLFTGDNNSDSGDRARFTYILEGGDSGWSLGFQYLSDRGPWNREGWWHMPSPKQPAFICPPVAHITSGPSGLTFNPGVGLPAEYKDHFFLVDFRGGPANSGVLTFKTTPHGAGFKIDKTDPFIWNVLATDCEFGFDGAFYVSDWVNGWEGEGKGRIYRVVHDTASKDPQIERGRKLMERGPTALADLRDFEVIELLSHPDMRLRMRVQFALADRGRRSIGTFTRVLDTARSPYARLHAIWGLGQIGRTLPAALEPVAKALADNDPIIRAQAAKVLGEDKYQDGYRGLAALLRDEDAHVRSLAAIALGKLGKPTAVAPLLAMLRENNDQDPWLRHAGAYGLARIGDADALVAAAGDENAAARMGVLLALRQLRDARVAIFLKDSDPRLVVEAARAINDLSLPDAMPSLAAVMDTASGGAAMDDALLRRALNANLRVGTAERATATAVFAARGDVPEHLRLEAMNILKDWIKPSSRDRVMNLWRPILTDGAAERSTDELIAAIEPKLASLLDNKQPESVRVATIELIGQYRIKSFSAQLTAISLDRDASVALRLGAQLALHQTGDPALVDVVTKNVSDDQPQVRSAALVFLSRIDPVRAVASLSEILDQGAPPEQQGALNTLAGMKRGEADAVIVKWLDKLIAGEAPGTIQLELLDAAQARASSNEEIKVRLTKYQNAQKADDLLRGYRHLLAGGDAQRGRAIFWEKVEAQCIRCHKVATKGAGEAGPDLGDVGLRATREELMESIILPSRKITEGFDAVQVEMEDGELIVGVLKKEEGRDVFVATIDGIRKLDKKKITSQRRGLSPMPSGMDKLLKPAELRDLVEYLASLKTPPAEKK